MAAPKPVKTKAEPQSVYALLGYADHKGMEVKACLASQISDAIKKRGMTQSVAADLIGMPQPKLSNMLRGQFRGVSESKMMDCLIALGKDVDIVIRTSPKSRSARLSVTSPKRARSTASAAPGRRATT